MAHPQLDDFLAIFEGLRGGYGTYLLTGETREGGKVLGKAASIGKPVTRLLWDDHLCGRQSLGIIPINEESLARFAAIDIDVYPLNLEELNTQVQQFNLPLVVCRTKSGGAHLYLFLSEMMPVIDMHRKLREMSALLGHANADIYPKQTKILVARGDSGNWINMPYFKGVETDRYALGPDNGKLTPGDFIKHVRQVAIAPKDLLKLKCSVPEQLPGGPPCLNHLATQGFPQGARNNGLLNLAVYCKKAYGDQWAHHVEKLNQQLMKPPLSTKEVLDVIRSVGRKSYVYTCKAQPLEPHCNAAICRACKHGVGGADLGMPRFGTLAKLNTVPPIWFVDIETDGGSARVELTTEELQTPRLFQQRCMSSLNMMPIALKMDNWQPIVAALMREVNVLEVPIDATPVGQLLEHLESFCLSKVTARSAEEMLLGKPWVNGDKVHFRLADFLKYLERSKFKMLELNRIQLTIQAIQGYGKKFHNLRGKGANCISLPVSAFTRQTEPFDLPPKPPEVI